MNFGTLKILTSPLINQKLHSYFLKNLCFQLHKQCFHNIAKSSLYSVKRYTNGQLYKHVFRSLNLFANSTKKYKLGLSGAVLYEKIVDRLDYNYFYKEFFMDDTLFSWFLVTEVHVWMLMYRIMQEGKDGLILRNYIVETMWNDVKIRAKKLSDNNFSSLNAHLELLSEQFNASIIGYDEGIALNDAFLADHIWRRFFNCKSNNPEQVEKIVYYIRKQVNVLSNIKSSEIFSLSVKIHWIYV